MKTFRYHFSHLTPHIFLLLIATSVTAQTIIIDPGEVVKMALTHSPTLKAVLEECRAASARRLQADAGLIPRLDAQGQAQHFEGLENRAFGPGVVIPVIENQYAASLALIQPLYTGGRISAQKRGARFVEEATLRTHAAACADLTLESLSTYWQWSKAGAQVTAYEVAVARVEAFTTDTRNLKAAGMATDNDLLAAEVLSDQIRLQLDEARRQEELGRVQLSRLPGHDFTAGGVPRKQEAPDALPPPSGDQAITNALAHREELAALRLISKSGDERVKATRAEARPQLALVARYEEGRPNVRDFPPDETWRGDALIGASLTWNLFDGGLTRARTAEACSQATRDQLQLQAAEENITAQVRQASLTLRHAILRLKTAEHAVAAATRNLEVANNLWKQGMARHSDVLDAEAKRTASDAEYIAARVDLILARAGYRHATGLPLSPSSL